MCDWLEGLGASAQERADGDLHAADLARRALAARPSGAAAARAELALGLALGGAKTADERVRSLRAAVAGAPPGTRGAILAALGEALLEQGDARGATESFRTSAAEGTGAVAARARWRAADALHAGGSTLEAVAAWRELLSDPLASNFAPPARLAFAADLRANAEPELAAEILRSLWSTLPERSEADSAEALLSAWRDGGAPIPPFSGEERIARALRLVAVGRASAAQLELTKAAASALPAPAATLALARATAFLALGQPAEAAAEAAPHARSTDAGIRRGAQHVLARAATRQRRFADAIRAWSAVAASKARVPGLSPRAQGALRDDAEFFAAWLHFDAGAPGRAATALAQLARKRPRSRRAGDARWFSAWALLRMGATQRADEALRRIDEGPDAARVRYWRARISRDDAVTGALLRSVVSLDPLGYYGLLACARLRGMGVACAPPPLSAGPPIPDLEQQPQAAQLRQAAALAAAGLRDDALAELAALAGSRGARRAAPLVAELASFLGDPILPFRLARDRIGLSRRSLAWSFPDAWPGLVVPAARTAGIDPALARAVMRRESGFRREARSAAGAVGLLQIMPSTASRLTALLRLPSTLADHLEDPAVNIPLGVGYLGLLVERFRDPLVAVAAYNAGPAAVTRWSRAPKDVSLDVWVESIPFQETRGYVRAVVANWAGERASAGEPMPELDPDRPVTVMEDGVSF